MVMLGICALGTMLSYFHAPLQPTAPQVWRRLQRGQPWGRSPSAHPSLLATRGHAIYGLTQREAPSALIPRSPPRRLMQPPSAAEATGPLDTLISGFHPPTLGPLVLSAKQCFRGQGTPVCRPEQPQQPGVGVHPPERAHKGMKIKGLFQLPSVGSVCR